jgi:hypothetical protein
MDEVTEVEVRRGVVKLFPNGARSERECAERSLPFAEVFYRRKYATVGVDRIFVPGHREDWSDEQRTAAETLLASESVPPDLHSAGPTYPTATRVPNEGALPLARRLLTVALS